MPGLLKLNIKEAKDLADEIERQGGNTDGLRAAIKDAGNPENGNTAVPAGRLSAEEYLAEKRLQTEIEHGTNLECMICQDKFDHLLSGTCENCWREWMLSAKPKD